MFLNWLACIVFWNLSVEVPKSFLRIWLFVSSQLSFGPVISDLVVIFSQSICTDRFCRPIMTKPKPAPAKPAAPETPTPPQGNEHQPQGGDANANAGSNENPADGSNEVPLASEEPMETDKPEAPQSSA